MREIRALCHQNFLIECPKPRDRPESSNWYWPPFSDKLYIKKLKFVTLSDKTLNFYHVIPSVSLYGRSKQISFIVFREGMSLPYMLWRLLNRRTNPLTLISNGGKKSRGRQFYCEKVDSQSTFPLDILRQPISANQLEERHRPRDFLHPLGIGHYWPVGQQKGGVFHNFVSQ